MRSDEAMLRIVKATRSQVPDIVELWVEFMRYHENMMPDFAMSEDASRVFAGYLRGLIGKRNHRLLIARDGDKLIGYALLSINKRPQIFETLRYGMICDAFVTKKYRRRGVGAMFLDESLSWFRKKGVSRVELVVATKNKVGYSFWKRSGFTEHAKKMYLML